MGWEIFEFVGLSLLLTPTRHPTSDPAFTFARGSAVSGRNAIALAPSLPTGLPAEPENLVLPADEADEIADAIARLASALSARLRKAARLTADADDRTACEDAARDADWISELLARGS